VAWYDIPAGLPLNGFEVKASTTVYLNCEGMSVAVSTVEISSTIEVLGYDTMPLKLEG